MAYREMKAMMMSQSIIVSGELVSLCIIISCTDVYTHVCSCIYVCSQKNDLVCVCTENIHTCVFIWCFIFT